MHEDLRRGPLTFPELPLGERETPRDLKQLLYKGGAGLRVDKVERAIQQGLLGDVLDERVELVYLVHEFICGKLAGGGSPGTVLNLIGDITGLFSWAEGHNCSLTYAEIEGTYLRCVAADRKLTQ